MATPNMPAGEWPDLEPEDLRAVGELVQDVQSMKDHQDDPPPVTGE